MFNSGLLQQMIARGEGALVSLHLHTLGFLRKYLLTVADKVCIALDKAVQIGTHTHTHTHAYTHKHTHTHAHTHSLTHTHTHTHTLTHSLTHSHTHMHTHTYTHTLTHTQYCNINSIESFSCVSYLGLSLFVVVFIK